jgi:hypothetical protein
MLDRCSIGFGGVFGMDPGWIWGGFGLDPGWPMPHLVWDYAAAILDFVGFRWISMDFDGSGEIWRDLPRSGEIWRDLARCRISCQDGQCHT